MLYFVPYKPILHYLKSSLVLLLLLLGCFSAQAQFPTGFPRNTSTSSQNQGSNSNRNNNSNKSFVSEPDTFGIFMFHADNPDNEIPFNDTLLADFEEYNPIRQRDLELAFLGNVGSATRQLFYQPRFSKGVNVGFNQFDPYILPPNKTPYYRLKRSYSRAYYSQGESQQDIIFKGEFSLSLIHI